MTHRERPYSAMPLLVALGLAGLAALRIAFAAPAAPLPTAAVPVASVIELQPFREVSSSRIESAGGARGTATLVNLNPRINAWYVLSVLWANGSRASYHLENPRPRAQRLTLDPTFTAGIEILEGSAREPCTLFGNGANDSLAAAARSPLPYASLCEGRLFLRNRVQGHQTRLESEAEFVRNQLWGGEKITVMFHHLLSDTHRETGELHAGSDYAASSEESPEQQPVAALLDPKYAKEVLTAGGLGIALQGVRAGLTPGAWYGVRDSAGIYVSVLEPQLIDAAILASERQRVNTLDAVEASSLVYLVAFDLDHFDLHYALGTAHPSVEWSQHIQPGMREAKSPGPDDIGTIAPLVSTGQIGPEAMQITVASFTGGFKRAHGAFKYGPLAIVNHASHYGFLENGVVLSRLQPELATLLVLDDGSVQMRTWQAQDESLIGRIRYARQNGVPLVELDERSQSTVPGRWVKEWGPGNWSGSEDMRLRTLRAAAAMQWSASKHFLIYAVFTDATPSAMARVFQAYRCRYAMPLDMNALEHSYLALYRHTGSELQIEYLLQGMREVDKADSGPSVPRFLAYPDNRDFFYITRRGQ